MSESSTIHSKKDSSSSPLLHRVFSRTFPVFSWGWMLTFSLLITAVIFVAMNIIDRVSSALISSTGYAAITSSNYARFFRSWQGYAIVFVFMAVIGLTALVVTSGIILLSDDILNHRKVRIPGLLKNSVLSVRLFMCREAIPHLAYYFVFLLFFTVSLLAIVPSPFEIPGYIYYLISKRLWAMALYFAVFILICIPMFRNPIILHDIIIMQKKPADAVIRTRALAHANRRYIFSELMWSAISFCLILLAASGIFIYMPLLVQTASGFIPAAPRRILVLLASYTGLSVLITAVLLALWILPLKTSMIYHRLINKPVPVSRAESSGHGFLRFMIPVYLILLIAAVAVSYLHFEYIFPPARPVEAVVHRLGGDLDTENTLEGMEKALELGAPAMETDIQRTRDGEYVIFHDATLKRMCGLKSKIHDLTLEQVRALSLPAPDLEERHIPTLSEILDHAKGRARLYLELKGTDADIKMAKDVARMVRKNDMEDQCVLISMNYNLIRYISREIKDIPCGYLYFFAYGTPSNLSGDILLAQSNAISIERTRAIRRKGKKMYCWTVNSRQKALDMVRQRVDGIISDRYDIISSVLDHMESRNDYERIMDVLLI